VAQANSIKITYGTMRRQCKYQSLSIASEITLLAEPDDRPEGDFLAHDVLVGVT
jgi:hypothetical protein